MLVKRLMPAQKTAGGLCARLPPFARRLTRYRRHADLPDTAQKKEIEAEVVAVGPGALGKDGARIQMVLQAGDRVLLPEYGGHELEMGNEVGGFSG